MIEDSSSGEVVVYIWSGGNVPYDVGRTPLPKI